MGEFSKGRNKTFWYSDARPQGTGNEGLTYNKETYAMVSRVVNNLHGKNKVTNEEVKEVQSYLVDIGYLDPYYVDSYGNHHSSIDGYVGGRTHGAAKRYLFNLSTENMNAGIFDFIERAGDTIMNLFK
tara:strand:- start:627 stop:1010 length:384 start_codon:yes stop_codon:yes gene_type:complete